MNNLAQLVSNLKLIKACAQKHLDAARDAYVRGPVNWGDLRVIYAEYVMDDDENESYRVLIEEADPGASELQEYVQAGLSNDGITGVQVVTEW